MKITTLFLKKLSYIYILIPIFLFLFFWLKPIFMILAICLAIFCYKKALNSPNKTIEISKAFFFFLILISTLWCAISGIGELTYQSPDWNARNAVIKDLINFSYPVYYDNGSTLVYYFGQFLPAAVFGKIFSFFGADIYLKAANYFNLFYASFGICLVVLNLIDLTSAKNKQLYFILLILIFFSGVDLFDGNFYLNFLFLHLERHGFLQYSSNTTLMFWVYNQAIMPWLIVTLFLKEPYKIQNYGFYLTSMLFYSPLAFCGFAFYTFVIYLKKLFKNANKRKIECFLKRTFSFANLSCIFLFVIFYLFFKSNESVGNDSFKFVNSGYFKTIVFVLSEAGIYFLLMFYKYRKNTIFLITAFSLCLIPFIRYDQYADFCMRASIPALFILMIFTIKFLLNKNNKIIKSFLIFFLILGSLTPLVEFLRCGIYTFAVKKEVYSYNIDTLNNKIRKDNCKYHLTSGLAVLQTVTNYCNYGTFEPEKHIFFKYIAKNRRQTM